MRHISKSHPFPNLLTAHAISNPLPFNPSAFFALTLPYLSVPKLAPLNPLILILLKLSTSSSLALALAFSFVSLELSRSLALAI